MVYLLIFIIGLCVGSFLNVLIYTEINTDKLQRGTDEKKGKYRKWLPRWLVGRSHCDYCKKQIVWHDNIPLLSYILLKGKCRHCLKKITLQYPIVEFLTGIQFVWIYFLIKSNFSFFARFEGFYSLLILFIWLIIGACFLAIFISDLRYQIIPDTAVIIGVVMAVFKVVVDYRYTGMIDFSLFPSALINALFFLCLIVITKGKGMGFGDVKLAFLIGLILGFPKTIVAIMVAFLTGALLGVILIFTGQKKFKSKIAFGPFLILGTLAALFFGIFLWHWFIRY